MNLTGIAFSEVEWSGYIRQMIRTTFRFPKVQEFIDQLSNIGSEELVFPYISYTILIHSIPINVKDHIQTRSTFEIHVHRKSSAGCRRLLN
jgi:hypothetical protein